MGATLTNVLPLLREHYRENVTEIFFTCDKSTTPSLAMLESRSMSEEGFGRGYVVPVEYGMGASVSADFSVAQGISQAAGTVVGSSALRDRWVVQACKIEATAQWDRDAILGAKGDGELFDVMEREMNAKIMRVRQRLAEQSVEGGWGRVGTLSAVTATTLTFNQAGVVNRLEKGDKLVAAAAEGTGNILTFGQDGIATVSQIDPDTGIVTVTCTGSDVTAGSGQAWTASSVIFHYGDRSATAASMLCTAGLRGWIQGSAASGSWMGITRTGIPQLCGYTVNASGLDHSTALIKAANRLLHYGSKADLCLVSTDDYATLTSDKDAQKLVEITLGEYKIGFSGIVLQTNAGPVPVVPDSMMEQGTAYMGPFKDKKYAPFLAHNGDLVNIDETDGNTITRLASSTAFEMRMYFRGAIIHPAPGKFAVITNLATS